MSGSGGPRRLSFARSMALLAGFWLLVFNLLDGFALVRQATFQATRIDVASPLFNTGAYLALYAACWGALVLLLSHERRIVRHPAWALSGAAVIAHAAFWRVNGYGFTYHEAALTFGESEFIGEAIWFFLGSWLGIAGMVAIVVFSYERFVVPRISGPRSLAWCLVLVVVVPAHMAFLDRSNAKVYETPMPFRVTMLLDYARRYRAPYVGPRDAVALLSSEKPMADHVVLIVDESIRGDLLGLNGGPLATTSRLAERQRAFVNYGVASSPSNASATTQLILVSGLQPEEVPDTALRSLKGPSVFAYLANAGFTTFLVNAQHTSDRPTNFMSQYDLDALDGRFVMRRLEPAQEEWE